MPNCLSDVATAVLEEKISPAISAIESLSTSYFSRRKLSILKRGICWMLVIIDSFGGGKYLVLMEYGHPPKNETRASGFGSRRP